jgi:hypothetical protein
MSTSLKKTNKKGVSLECFFNNKEKLEIFPCGFKENILAYLSLKREGVPGGCFMWIFRASGSSMLKHQVLSNQDIEGKSRNADLFKKASLCSKTFLNLNFLSAKGDFLIRNFGCFFMVKKCYLLLSFAELVESGWTACYSIAMHVFCLGVTW